MIQGHHKNKLVTKIEQTMLLYRLLLTAAIAAVALPIALGQPELTSFIEEPQPEFMAAQATEEEACPLNPGMKVFSSLHAAAACTSTV